MNDVKQEEFTTYTSANERVDSFYYKHLAGHPEYCKLWDLMLKVLILSHGQAEVERGFSINANCSDDNLEMLSLVSRRRICDYMTYVGGIEHVLITKELLNSCRMARQRYDLYLADCKKKETASEAMKRKREETKMKLMRKKQKLTDSVNQLQEALDKLEDSDSD